MKSIILGTQLLGSELNYEESTNFLNFAYDSGLRKFDTAERYPFPETNKTYGLTEKIIGEWIKNNKIKRTSVEIATKITGRNFGEIKKIYSKRITAKSIVLSAERSLKRLKLDYIDLLYLHWPDRFTNNFGRTYYNPDPDPTYYPIEEQIAALNQLKRQGKIKSFGLSNETPWGLMKFISLDKKNRFLSSIQEEYSILNRNVERAIKEIVLREKIKFYCYSPLSGGLLAKKYIFVNNKIKNTGNSNWKLIRHKKKHLNFSILLTNDEDISMVNNKFRKLNMPTNVLSFESNLNPKNFFKINEKEVYLGDIIISMERIFYESKINNMYFNDHFIHIFMHGILHVLGYDHKTDNQQQEMEQKEISILNELGIENPYE